MQQSSGGSYREKISKILYVSFQWLMFQVRQLKKKKLPCSELDLFSSNVV